MTLDKNDYEDLKERLWIEYQNNCFGDILEAAWRFVKEIDNRNIYK